MKRLYYLAAAILFGIAANAQEVRGSLDPNITYELQPQMYEGDVHNMAGLHVKPEFPGGIAEFHKLLYSNFNYDNLQESPDGTYRAYISFIIEKDGTITNCKVSRDPGYGIGEEALRVVKLSSKWSPGYQDGIPVRTSFTQPVVVNISN